MCSRAKQYNCMWRLLYDWFLLGVFCLWKWLAVSWSGSLHTLYSNITVDWNCDPYKGIKNSNTVRIRCKCSNSFMTTATILCWIYCVHEPLLCTSIHLIWAAPRHTLSKTTSSYRGTWVLEGRLDTDHQEHTFDAYGLVSVRDFIRMEDGAFTYI